MENATSLIRSNLREQRNQERQERRFEVIKHNRRALGETDISDRVISTAEITELANDLKSKKITLKGLKVLKQGFIQSEDNIRKFLNVNGGLHALVREVTGRRTQYQLEAINCCCNLALGNEKAGMIVTKAVAPYLISQLDCFSHVFLDICVWTLGNLAGSGEKPWSVLKSQGVLPKLLHLISLENFAQTAVYALTMYTKTGFSMLEDNEFEAIAVEACQLMTKEASVYWLIYLLSCSEKCDLILLKNFVVSNAFRLLFASVTKAANENDSGSVLNVTALLRIIGNLCGGQKECVEDLMKPPSSQRDVLHLFSALLIYPFQHVKQESLWVIGNVASHLPEPEMFLSELEPNLSRALKESTESTT